MVLETVEFVNQDPKHDVPPELVSHFTEHETPDAFYIFVSRIRHSSRCIRNRTKVFF